MATGNAAQKQDRDENTTGPFFHVNNDRKGPIEPQGEELSGTEILARVGLTAERYELFTLVKGRTGEAVTSEAPVRVKPGDHFRATLRGADYSREDGAA